MEILFDGYHSFIHSSHPDIQLLANHTSKVNATTNLRQWQTFLHATYWESHTETAWNWSESDRARIRNCIDEVNAKTVELQFRLLDFHNGLLDIAHEYVSKPTFSFAVEVKAMSSIE